MSEKETYTIEYGRENFATKLVANLTEKTQRDSAFDPDSYEQPYNPDDLYKAKGDYSVYESMMQDDQVDSAVQLKKDLVLGSGFEITGSEDVKAEIIDDVTLALQDDQETPFEDQLEEILTAYEFGFSLTEKIFKKRDDGKLTLGALKTRHPNTWKIEQDKFGNVSEYIQTITTGDIKVPSRNLIHYVNKRRFQNPFGTSDLRSAHTAWRIKVEVIKYYAIFLEKYAGGTAVAKYPRNMPKGPRNDLFTAIKKLQASTAITLPEGVELDIMEAKSDGEAFEKAINLFNTLIGRAVMIPDLLGYSGGETQGGSFSLGENQMEVFFKHIRRRRRTLEKLVNHHVIKPIVIFNYGMLDEFPKFQFKPINEEDSKELAKLWIEAVKGKFYEPSDDEINHFREQINFPLGDVERVSQPQPIIGGGIGDVDEQGRPSDAKGETPEEVGDNTEGDEPAGGERVNFRYEVPEGSFSHRTDFRAVEKQLDGAEEGLLNDALPIVDDMLNRLSSSISKKRIIENKNVDALAKLKLDRKADLRRAFEKHFKDLFVAAKAQASRELFRENFAKLNIEQQFLEFLEREIIFFIGDVEQTWIKNVRVHALEAIRDGLPFSAVELYIREELSKKAKVSIERWARTKSTEVFNRGRKEFFESSDVLSGYEYSAVMDGRTTVVCAGLHGKRFVKGTEPNPPLHYNCRSLLIPITRFEKFKPDTHAGGGTVTAKRGEKVSLGKKRPINDFIKENKGEGFSVE